MKKMKRFALTLLSVLMVMSMMTACVAPTPEQVVETVVVREEVVVTPTPEAEAEMALIEGYPTEDENEAKAAMAADAD